MKNNEFKELVDQNLSGLVWDERKRQKVLHALSEEEKPVKKVSTTFILIAAIVCLSVTALAAGLIFSPRYDTVRIANQAMEDKYGITPDLLSLFRRDVKENEDGTSTVVYSTTEDIGPVSRIGEYTVMVDGPKATVSWSNEGKDTSGGLAAEAYGPEQLHTISYDYGNAMQQLMELGIIPTPDYSPNPRLADGQIDDEEWTEEDQAEWEQSLAEVEESTAPVDASIEPKPQASWSFPVMLAKPSERFSTLSGVGITLNTDSGCACFPLPLDAVVPEYIYK